MRQKSRRSGLHVPFQKDRRSKRLLISFYILRCWHDKRCSFFFVDLKNSRLKNKKRSSYFGLSTPKSIRRMSWSSNSRGLLRTRTGERLDDWLCHVKECRIREFQGFVAGVRSE